ncbi:auxin-induced protein 6b [Phtheirospermum japonicum]|uniref:Auxin-induced protein 6b n=1 Tax=Phtheirospermum japonicum TaxID=374723 RepID=A0A830CK28_9LAMI|nr:auxin-induced protein 6b [Phtheirospermum japonicum]
MITQIVRLRHVVKRWKNKSLKRSSTLCYSSSSSDTDESADAHPRTPSGSVAVYVGSERRRFVIPTRFLNLPVFVALLDQAEEEFGFQAAGGLALLCETDFFRDVLRFLDEDEEKFRGLGLEEFSEIISQAGFESYDSSSYSSSCKEPSSSCSFTPFLHNARV